MGGTVERVRRRRTNSVRLRQTDRNTGALGAIVETRTGSIVRTAQVGTAGSGP